MTQVVILAGGMGTRLKSVTGDLPKPPALDKQLPVELRSQGRNRLHRETVYWVFDESTAAFVTASAVPLMAATTRAIAIRPNQM